MDGGETEGDEEREGKEIVTREIKWVGFRDKRAGLGLLVAVLRGL